MIVKKLASLMMLVVLAGLTAGDVFAEPKKNTNKRETTKTTAKSNAKSSKATKVASTKIEKIPAPVDEDQFVADNLAQSGTGRLSKYFIPGVANEVDEFKIQTSNYNDLPPHFRKLVDANKEKYFYDFIGKEKYHRFFISEHFELHDNHNRIIVKYGRLDSADMMAVFERPETKSKTSFAYSKALAKAIPPEDMVFAEKLSDVINDVITYLYEVPFFVPDMDRFKRGDYAGKFIPEKYLVKGGRLNKVAPELYDGEKKGYYSVWGLPIYDVSQVETGEISDPSGCFSFSKYYQLQVVNELVLLNLDSFQDQAREGSLKRIRETQYKQALSLLVGLKESLKKEREVVEKAGKLNKTRIKILAEIEAHLNKIIPPAEKTLNDALQQNKFIYSLNNPQGKPKKIELKKAGIAKTEYTTGNVRN